MRVVAMAMIMVVKVQGYADDVACSSESGEDDEDKEMGELGEDFGQAGQGKELDRNMWAPEDEKEQEVSMAYGDHLAK